MEIVRRCFETDLKVNNRNMLDQFHKETSGAKNWVNKLTLRRVVCSNLHRTFFAFSASLAAAPVKKTVKDGAFGFLLILIISCAKEYFIKIYLKKVNFITGKYDNPNSQVDSGANHT